MLVVDDAVVAVKESNVSPPAGGMQIGSSDEGVVASATPLSSGGAEGGEGGGAGLISAAASLFTTAAAFPAACSSNAGSTRSGGVVPNKVPAIVRKIQRGPRSSLVRFGTVWYGLVQFGTIYVMQARDPHPHHRAPETRVRRGQKDDAVYENTPPRGYIGSSWHCALLASDVPK